VQQLHKRHRRDAAGAAGLTDAVSSISSDRREFDYRQPRCQSPGNAATRLHDPHAALRDAAPGDGPATRSADPS